MNRQLKATFYNFLSTAFVRLRVLQVLMVCALFLVVMRLERIYSFSENIFVNSAKAEETKDHPAEAKKDNPPQEPKHQDKKKPEPEKPKDKFENTKKADGFSAENFDILELSGEQVEVLRTLSKRHRDLVERERSISEREATLQAIEKRLDTKTEELKKIQDYLKQLLGQKDEKEKESIKKLVLVYQKMKPQEAATILQELDLETLLNIMDEMKETNVSSILSKMEPLRARFLTLEIAQRRKKLEEKMQKEHDSNQEVAKLMPEEKAKAEPPVTKEAAESSPKKESDPVGQIPDTVKTVKPASAPIKGPEKPKAPSAQEEKKPKDKESTD